MTRHFAAALTLLALFAFAYCAHPASAATPLPPAPSTGWCSDGSNATGYFGVRGCPGDTPPPPIGTDPLGMTSIFGKFASHSCGAIRTNDGQEFGALFGQMEGGSSIVFMFPWRPNSIWFQIPPGRRYSALLRFPLNPGVARRFLKGDAYAGCGGVALSASAAFDWQVITADSLTAPPTGKCSGTSFFGDRSYFLGMNPSNSPATDNLSMCNFRYGGIYRLMIDPRPTTVTDAIFTLN